MLVMVWTHVILPGSQTFIRNQTDTLRSWHATLFGLGRENSPLVRDSDHVLFGAGIMESLGRRAATVLGISGRVARSLDEVRPTLVHVHFVSSCAYLVSRLARARGLPVVVTAHGVDVTSPPSRRGLRGRLVRAHARTTLRRASLVIAVSEFIRSRCIELGAEPDKVVVHHIGIPVPAETSPGSPKEWDIAFVGRFIEKKGVRDLLRAVATLVPDLNPRCVLVGDGPLLAEARRFAGEAGIDAEFLGAQPPDVVAATLRASRVFAAPSRTARSGDAEGFGMVFLEAAAAGLPIASTLHGGIPEAVVDGVTGLLSPEGDADALAANLRRLLTAPALCRTMGAAGRSRVERDFDITKQTALLERIYDQLMESGRPPHTP